MKIFTLEQAESYFCVYDNISRKKNSLINETNTKKKEFLTLKFAEHLYAIRNEENKKIRILYLINYLSNHDDAYKLKDFQVVGNYEDVILRLKPKVTHTTTTITEVWT